MKETIHNTRLQHWRQTYETPHMTDRQLEQMKQSMEKARTDNRRKNFQRRLLSRGTAAAVIAAFVILPNTSAQLAYAMGNIPLLGGLVRVVTLRDYQYQDGRNTADIQIPELVPQTALPDKESALTAEAPETKPLADTQTSAAESAALQKSTAEINAEIQEIAGRFQKEFEENLAAEGGYQDVIVKSEILHTSPDFFTLKLICYQGAGSGAEWNYYYTIDLHTGERLQLRDLFREGSDYITPISENIKTQMREQMAADPDLTYWLDQEIEDWNFRQITDETAFYLNENGNLVISFNEGDVAPMYMGVVTFEIPADVINDIRVVK